MADYFKVSIDFLLTGLRFSQLEDSNRFIDKNTLHIVQYKGNKILTKREYNSVIKIRIRAEDAINGFSRSLALTAGGIAVMRRGKEG